MRILLFILLIVNPLSALDNAIRFTAAATQTGRPFDLHPAFAKDEICDYPQPFFDGVTPATWGTEVETRWPVSSLCSSGSVKTASVYFQANVTNTTTHVIDFRNNINPCSSGSSTDCNNAGMTGAAILAHNGGTWTATMTADAKPDGSASTQRVTNARTMITNNEFTYLHRSAAATKILVEDRTTALTRDFGWTKRRVMMPDSANQYSIGTTNTSRLVVSGSHWAGITTPFKAVVDAEIVSICYVSTTHVYFGTTAGTNESCASTAGRGVDGTTPAAHATSPLVLKEATWLTSALSGNTMNVNNGAAFSSPSVVEVVGEKVRICKITGNVLTVGTGTDGCPENSGGRYWAGTNSLQTTYANTPVSIWTSATDVWVDAAVDKQKSLHPVFIITVYPGFASIGIEYFMFNSWTGRQQDQEYDIAIASSTDTYSKTHIRHVPGTAWKFPDGEYVGTCASDVCDRKMWDATLPAAGKFNMNMSYLRYSKFISNDDTISVAQALVDNAWDTNSSHSQGTTYAWANGTKGKIESEATITANRSACAFTWKDLSGPGTRWDVGLNPTWNLAGLYAMGTSLTDADKWLEWTLGSAGCAGSFPYIWFDSDTDTSKKFCNSGASTASPTATSCSGANTALPVFGYPVSIDARPGLNYYPEVNATETFYPVGTVSYNLWTTNDINSHMPEMLYIPWLLTGDWYYRTLMGARAGWTMWAANGYPGYNASETWNYYNKQFRKGAWGLLGPIGAGGGPRNMAWGFNTLHNSYLAQLDGSAVKQYIYKKIATNLAVWEGKFNITNGNYYQPCLSTCDDDYSYWHYGRRRQGNNADMSTFSLIDALAGGPYNDQPTLIDNTYTRLMMSYWGEMYFLVAISDAYNKGLTEAGPVRAQMYSTFNNMIRHPDVTNPFMVSAYRSPGNACEPLGCAQAPNYIGAEFMFPSWSSWFNQGWTAYARNTYYKDLDVPEDPLGRAWLTTQVGTLGEDTTYGKHVSQWLNGVLRYQGSRTTNPSWWASPFNRHELPDLRVVGTPGATTATVMFTRPTSTDSCEYLLYTGGSRPTVSLQTGESSVTNSSGSRDMTLSLTGLTTATSYGVRVTCSPSARGYVTFTTN